MPCPPELDGGALTLVSVKRACLSIIIRRTGYEQVAARIACERRDGLCGPKIFEYAIARAPDKPARSSECEFHTAKV